MSPYDFASNDELAMLLLMPDVQPQEPVFRRRGVTMLTTANDTRCRYPSKFCRNTRVRKASGALHRYCAYHRDKANANQKRWVDRQRESSVSPTASSSSSAASPTYADTKYRWILAAAPDQSCSRTAENQLIAQIKQEPELLRVTGASVTSSAATLDDDDWNSLLSILVSDHSSATPSRSVAAQ